MDRLSIIGKPSVFAGSFIIRLLFYVYVADLDPILATQSAGSSMRDVRIVDRANKQKE